MSVGLVHVHWRPDTSNRLVAGHHLLVELERGVTTLLDVFPHRLGDLVHGLVSHIHSVLRAVVVVENNLWVAISLDHLKHGVLIFVGYFLKILLVMRQEVSDSLR